ncbi:MAG TPA: AMP-binding protein [Verrucomicrobiae bacterium]|nr:AMP-binding protein [Verrucomicrobiae bacterium]
MQYLVHHFLDQACREFPRKTALIHGRERLRYLDVQKAADGLARRLLELGLKKGDRVGIYLEKSVEEVISVFAVSKAGGVFVILNSALKPDQVAYIMGQSGMRCLVTGPLTYGHLPPALRRKPEFVLALEGGKIRTVIGSRAKRTKDIPFPKDLTGNDLASIIYTSGSTGFPKGVMLTHHNVCLAAHSGAKHLRNESGDVLMGVLPLSFDYGLFQLTSAFKMTGTLVLKKFISAEDLLETARREKVDGIAGIPTILIPLAESRALNKIALRHLRYITNSGGKLPVKYFRKLRKALPRVKIFSMYGFTEAFRAAYLEPEELDRRPESIGKAVPNARIYVLDANGKECGPGQTGELVQAGPLVSRGYWKNPEATAAKIKQNPLHNDYDDPVCYSGDFVKKDKDGFLYFIGRKDQMLKCSGYRVSPDEIEAILHRHPQIRSAAASGIPDERLGHRIRVAAVLKSGASLKPEDLLAYCRRAMPSYMVPSEIRILDKLPLTAHGKINRALLAAGKVS